MITKQFMPTAAMFYKASRAMFHLTRKAKMFYGFFVLLPTVLLIFYIFRGESLTKPAIFGLPVLALFGVCVLYALCVMPLLQYFAVRKYFRANPSVNQLQNYTISEKGIRNFGNGFNSSFGWDKIWVRESRHFLLFYISRNNAYFIPLDILSPSEIDQIAYWDRNKS